MSYTEKAPMSGDEVQHRQLVATILAGILGSMSPEQIFNLDGVPLSRAIAKAEVIVNTMLARPDSRAPGKKA